MRKPARSLSFMEGTMVVVGLVVFAAIMYPAFATGYPDGRRMRAISNIKQCALGMLTYLKDSDEIFPYVDSSESLVETLHPYVKSDQTWSTGNSQFPGNFAMNPCLPGASVSDLKSPMEVPMLFDPFIRTPFENEDPQRITRPVAFADGHAKAVTEEKWTAADALLHLNLKKHGKPLD